MSDPEQSSDGDMAPCTDPGLQAVVDRVAAILEMPDADQAAEFRRLRRSHPGHESLVEQMEKVAAEIPPGPQRRARLTELISTAPSAAPRRESIGPYRILELLGEGGMGSVYLVEQREPVRRRVALKVIKLGMDSKQVIARFELERQALAVMNHPAIAKVFDADVTEAGQPYFVMELVEGIPITDYCDKNRLSFEERLRVFQQVCNGVQHAHQKGILHRDLKPANILVSRKDEQHVVKIIDFGLARATDHQLVSQTVYTEQGQLIGTPEYMSPEQAGGHVLDLDTRTDIYSLGVVLYELLTGELPFRTEDLRRRGLLEIQRIIQEEEPPKPSTRVSSVGDRASEFAKNRRVSIGALRRALHGELDWIVMRAMAKEPAHRYESATNFAMDLGRFLDHEPVMAGPPSAGYRLLKMARKYRLQLSAGLLVFTVAVVGAIVAWRYAVEAGENAEEATNQTNNAKAALAELTETERAVRRENDRFNRLSVVIQLQNAIARMPELLPAWPENVPGLESWMHEYGGDRFEQELSKVREALRQLRAMGSSREAGTEPRDRPSTEKLGILRRRVASLRRAMSVRQKSRQLTEPAVPSDLPTDPREIASMAWKKVDPDRGEEAFGDELLGLALARRALDLATDNQELYREALVWALFANGLDEEALAILGATRAALSSFEKRESILLQLLLQAAIADAPETLRSAEDELSRLEAEIQAPQFDDKADEFLYATLLAAERDLVAFLGADGAGVEMERRLDWARRVDDLTRNHPNARVTWAAAREAIRKADGVVASDLYGATRHDDHPIALERQVGLVPIGMNPVTKLWEFYHLRSAYDPRLGTDPGAIEIPVHRPDGSIDVREETGIIFVLVPGATLKIGSQSSDPNGENFDRKARLETPVWEVRVAPFFLARHELTQGQWLRLSLQGNSSRYFAGAEVPEKVKLTHPVERVSWLDCTALLEEFGLALPSGEEWEYGCRAGTSTPWFTGERASSLEGYANIDDASARRHPLTSKSGNVGVDFDDGYAIHSPVGAYKANAFGMHDVHGNISEWCRDEYPSGNRVARGGGFRLPADSARVTSMFGFPAATADPMFGLRPARALRAR